MDISFLYGWIQYLFPLEVLEAQFMQRALFGLLLLAPMTAGMGVQVVNFRLAFFSDAISHSAFAGVALGLIFAIHPHWTMPLLGVGVGVIIVALQRNSFLSSDTVIGVLFASVTAFGLAIVSREGNLARNVQQFLYGDILTIGDTELIQLVILFAIFLVFQFFCYNRLLYLGLDPTLAQVHRVRVAVYQYGFAALLALVVIFSVWAMGVLLVTALLVVPTAAARNIAKSAGSMFWWAMVLSVFCAVTGLIVSAQEWARTATGATIVLVAFVVFMLSSLTRIFAFLKRV